MKTRLNEGNPDQLRVESDGLFQDFLNSPRRNRLLLWPVFCFIWLLLVSPGVSMVDATDASLS